MRFNLDWVPEARSYIDRAELTRAGRVCLWAAINDLREISDDLRNDTATRSGPYFTFERAFRDSGILRQIRLIVDDRPAAFGVLSVVFADFR
jgi:hypothetical protein